MKVSRSKLICCLTLLFVYKTADVTANADKERKSNLLKCKFCKNFEKARSPTNILKLLGKPQPEPKNHVYNLQLDTVKEIGVIDKRFVSFSIDAIEMKREWKCFPLTSRKLHTLVSGLSPAYFRVGGTAQDFVTFQQQPDINLDRSYEAINYYPNTNCTPRFISYKMQTPFDISMTIFDDILKFSHSIDGLQFIYGLNGKKRNLDGSWDSSNAEMLVSHVKKKGYNVWWELGNEPNKYGKYGANYKVTGSQLAKDFVKLKSVTGENSVTIGPDITKPKKLSLMYLHDFILSEPGVDFLTYHQYYINQVYARLDDYVNPILLDNFAKQINNLLEVVKYTNSTTPLWLGESGSSSGGGKEGLSDSYVAGFLFLDKLGLAAKLGHKVVIRQSLYGGHYGMLDAITKEPLPDYWSGLLFKQLIGTKVLKVSTSSFLRAYSFCSRDKSGEVVLLLISLHKKHSVIVNLDSKLAGNDVTQYLLEPENGDLQSKKVYLNGNHLELIDDIELPRLEGKVIKQPITVPPLRYGFFVVRDAKINVCTN